MRDIEGCLNVGPGDRATLERLVADGKTPQKIVKRAKIVLLSGRGMSTNAICREAGVSKPTVWRWQKAYVEGGVARLLKDKGKGPRAGKKRIGDEVRLAIVRRTAQEKPANATHWSARTLAEEMGVGHTTVQRVWKEHGLKPHLTRTFKLSNDPQFAEKVVDVVGLYLDPPDNAVVLSVDEKSQIQALVPEARLRHDRTQPGLPLKKGRAATMTHDYKRNGTTTLFAALVAAKAKSVTELKLGEVIGDACRATGPRSSCASSRRSINSSPGTSMCTSCATTTGPTRPRRSKRGSSGTSASSCTSRRPPRPGFNLVERLFAEITRQRIRRGVFKSVADLEAAIEAWLAERNRKPKPFKWTAKADTILAKNARARRALEAAAAGIK